MARLKTSPTKSAKKLSDGGSSSSRLNTLIRNRCAIPVHELSAALGMSPLNLKRYCNTPLVYFTVNQLILLSYYLNLSLYEVLEVIGSEQLVIDVPPSFFAAVQNRKLKIDGEVVGNMLPPPKDPTQTNWFD